MNAGLAGWGALGLTFLLAIVLAVPVGLAYGWLLNRTRGQEMMVGTYLGFAVVSGMSIFWTMAPFTNPQLVWAIGGHGLRTTLTLTGFYDRLLDKLWAFEFRGVTVPTGLIARVLPDVLRRRAVLPARAPGSRSRPRAAIRASRAPPASRTSARACRRRC